MATAEGRIKFDEQVNRNFDLEKDFDDGKLADYLRRARISQVMPKEKILPELNAATKNRLNNGGLLFFAKEPKKFVSHAVFTCVLFRDAEGSDIIDRQEIEGSLVEIVENVMKFVEKNTRVAYRFTGKPQRENVYEYPLEAIRKAVINSVMHRDYLESGHNNLLKIFPDNLAVTNVWSKPTWFKAGRDTFRRNKVIADLFSRISWIEKVGSGLARMKAYCAKAKAPAYELDLDEKYFRIVFFKSKEYLELAGKWSEKWSELTERQVKILQFIQENPKIPRRELALRLGINQSAIQKHLETLKQAGLLERLGPAKGGHWKVTAGQGRGARPGRQKRKTSEQLHRQAASPSFINAVFRVFPGG